MFKGCRLGKKMANCASEKKARIKGKRYTYENDALNDALLARERESKTRERRRRRR